MVTTNEKREARDPTAAPDRLTELARQDAALARLVAANAGTPGSLLAELGDHADRAVRRRVVLNPATPAKVAAQVGCEFPNELLDNPAFDLYLMEEPDLLDGVGETTLRALLKRERCPPGFFAYAARKQDAALAMALLTNPAVGPELVQEMRAVKWWSSSNFNSPTYGQANAFVREACDLHHAATNEVEWRKQFEGAVATARMQGAAKQAQRSLARLALITDIASEAHAEALVPIESRPDIEVGALHLAALGSPLGRRALAMDSGTPNEVLCELLKSVDTNTADALLNNEAAAPLWTVELLAAAFRHADSESLDWWDTVPAEVLVELSPVEFPDEVRIGLNRLTSLPNDLGPFLAEKQTRAAVASHKAVSAELLKQLADEEPRAVSRNTAAPDALLRRLANSEPDAVAGNPSAPLDVLRELALDATPETRMTLVRNPASPPDLLVQLGLNASDELAALLAADPRMASNLDDGYLSSIAAPATILISRADAPASLLATFANHPHPYIRMAVAKHANTDGPTLARLAEDPDPGLQTKWRHSSRPPIRAVVAANPNTPSETLVRLADDADKGWEYLDHRGRRDGGRDPIREVVATNPAASTPTLDALAKGASKAMMWKLVRNPSVTTDQLVRWFRDPEVGRSADARSSLLDGLCNRMDELPADALDELVDALAKVTVSNAIHYARAETTLPALRDRIFQALASGPDEWARRSVGGEQTCPPQILADLARDRFEYTRKAVAANSATPVDALKRLASDRDADVRAAVAANIRTPPSKLAEMAEAEEERVRKKGTAGWAPRSELEKVHAALARNRRTPVDVLERLAAGSDLTVLIALAKRATVPRQLRILALTTLADGGEGREGEQAIRFAAGHPDTPVSILESFLRSSDRDVSRRARANKALGRARAHPPAVAAIRVRPADAERIEQALDADDAPLALAALRTEWLDELARPNAPSLSRLVALMQPDCSPAQLAKAQRSCGGRNGVRLQATRIPRCLWCSDW